MKPLLLTIIANLLLFCSVGFAGQMSSAGYSIKDADVTNGGALSASGSFQLKGTVRNEDGSSSQSTLYALRAGVWQPPKATVPYVELTIADALHFLQIAVDRVQATAADLKKGDVAPLVNGVPSPDGVIGNGDVVVVLRRIVGSVTW